MKVIKKINNNVAIGVDDSGREVVLFGKGIGFPSMPYALESMENVERTFYDVNPQFYNSISDIDETIWKLSVKMTDAITSRVPGVWNPNLAFILADHLNFAVERQRSDLAVNFPYSDEIEMNFPELNKYAYWIIKNVNHYMNIKLPKGEITCVAIHLINARQGSAKSEQETTQEKTNRILKELTRQIEDYFQFTIDHKDLNYLRFKYHIQYFIKRKEKGEEFHDDNAILLEQMKSSFPDTWECVMKLNEYLKQEYQNGCSDDELLYLMIHINRLYQRGLLPR